MIETIFQHTQLNSDDSKKVEVGVKGSVCRFCKPASASFRNASHSIPEFLGNRSVFTVDECDACNSLFGTGIECDLNKFIPPSWLTKIRGKKGYKRSQIEKGVELYADGKFINIDFSHKYEVGKNNLILEMKGSKFSPLKVYKAFVKILISLVPQQYLSDFDETILWIRSNSGFDFINHKPFVIVGQQRPDYRLPNIMSVTVIRQLLSGVAVYQLDCQFNNFFIKLPFSPKERCHFRVGHVVPESNEIFKKNFQEIDFSSYVDKHNYKLKFVIK